MKELIFSCPRRSARLASAGATAAALVLLASCGASVQASQTVSTTATASPDTVYAALRWTRASAEHRALYLQVFRAAEAALSAQSRGFTNGQWAVILDADETVLDNSEYELELARSGQAYTNASWNAWVRREAAPALPGAVAFTQTVRSLGGRVVFVTNRDEAYCDATRENLRRLQIPFDEVLCKAAGASDDKNPRFLAVERGTAPSLLAALHVVMWVGDNIQDFPNGSQALRAESPADTLLANLGVNWFLLPNALYGSWQNNPVP